MKRYLSSVFDFIKSIKQLLLTLLIFFFTSMPLLLIMVELCITPEVLDGEIKEAVEYAMLNNVPENLVIYTRAFALGGGFITTFILCYYFLIWLIVGTFFDILRLVSWYIKRRKALEN